MDFEIEKSVDKYLLCILRLRIFLHNKLSIHSRMADWGTYNFRRVAQELVHRKTS